MLPKKWKINGSIDFKDFCKKQNIFTPIWNGKSNYCYYTIVGNVLYIEDDIDVFHHTFPSSSEYKEITLDQLKQHYNSSQQLIYSTWN